MTKTNRRTFLHKSALGLAGTAAFTRGLNPLDFSLSVNSSVDTVSLGNTGLKVSRLALGTGTRGWRKTSNQKKLGEGNFIRMARHAYDRGVRFFETADMYGTHELVGKAMREVGRENITLLTKVMVYPHQDWYQPEPFQKSLDRFRRELGTDYIDLMLLHCMVNEEWPDEYKKYMEGLSDAKNKGIIGNIGLSCHDMGALNIAAESTWADVILARINYQGARMDGAPAQVLPLLKKARTNGKGLIGMKIFGCGELVQEEQREESLKFVLKNQATDCLTIGFESIEQVDDTIDRIMRIHSEG